MSKYVKLYIWQRVHFSFLSKNIGNPNLFSSLPQKTLSNAKVGQIFFFFLVFVSMTYGFIPKRVRWNWKCPCDTFNTKLPFALLSVSYKEQKLYVLFVSRDRSIEELP